MIAVDTNLIAYFFIPGEYTPIAELVFEADGDWAAPALWRSEFRNILALYLRQGLLELPTAKQIMSEAELLVRDEFEINSNLVLDLVATKSVSAYDAEFVVLARELSLLLLTNDRKILRNFGDLAVSFQDFLT